MIRTKNCPTHDQGKGRILPLGAFHVDRTKPDGVQRLCKECTNQRRRLRYAKNGSSPKDWFGSLRTVAMRDKIPFELSFEDYLALIGQPCAYGGGKRPEFNVGVDRKDPTGPYTLANVVPCCGRHNTIKSDLFTFESMKRIVREFQEARACGNQQRIKSVKAKSIPAVA